MLNPTLFLALGVLGMALSLGGLVMKPFFLRTHPPKADIAGYDLGWMFSFFSGFFALMPLPLMYIGLHEVAWRVCSLFMAMFLLMAVFVIFAQMITLDVRWPHITILLLVISLIFLTIELLNVFIWGTAHEYLWGVLWNLGVAFVQYGIAYAIVSEPDTTTPGSKRHYNHHASLDKRMPGYKRAGRPDQPPNGYTNAQHHHNIDTRPGRYPYGYTHSGARFRRNRRTNANTITGSNSYPRSGEHHTHH